MDYIYKGKKIGSLKDGIFRKRVQKSKHLMRLNDSWGMQYDAFSKIKDHCTEIRVLDTEENKVYTTTYQHMSKHGRVEDFGDGLQVFLPRSEWTVSDYTVK